MFLFCSKDTVSLVSSHYLVYMDWGWEDKLGYSTKFSCKKENVQYIKSFFEIHVQKFSIWVVYNRFLFSLLLINCAVSKIQISILKGKQFTLQLTRLDVWDGGWMTAEASISRQVVQRRWLNSQGWEGRFRNAVTAIRKWLLGWDK